MLPNRTADAEPVRRPAAPARERKVYAPAKPLPRPSRSLGAFSAKTPLLVRMGPGVMVGGMLGFLFGGPPGAVIGGALGALLVPRGE